MVLPRAAADAGRARAAGRAQGRRPRAAQVGEGAPTGRGAQRCLMSPVWQEGHLERFGGSPQDPAAGQRGQDRVVTVCPTEDEDQVGNTLMRSFYVRAKF